MKYKPLKSQHPKLTKCTSMQTCLSPTFSWNLLKVKLKRKEGKVTKLGAKQNPPLHWFKFWKLENFFENHNHFYVINHYCVWESKGTKLPFKESLYSLLPSNQISTRRLVSSLKEHQVKPNMMPDGIKEVIYNITTNISILFRDNDPLKPYLFHNNALYIVVRCLAMHVLHMLIYGGNRLNIWLDNTKFLGIKIMIRLWHLHRIWFRKHGKTIEQHITLEVSIGSTTHQVFVYCGCFNILQHAIGMILDPWDPTTYHPPSINM